MNSHQMLAIIRAHDRLADLKPQLRNENGEAYLTIAHNGNQFTFGVVEGQWRCDMHEDTLSDTFGSPLPGEATAEGVERWIRAILFESDPSTGGSLLEMFNEFALRSHCYGNTEEGQRRYEELRREIPELIKRECAFAELGGMKLAGAASVDPVLLADLHAALPATGGCAIHLGARTVEALRTILANLIP